MADQPLGPVRDVLQDARLASAAAGELSQSAALAAGSPLFAHSYRSWDFDGGIKVRLASAVGVFRRCVQGARQLLSTVEQFPQTQAVKTAMDAPLTAPVPSKSPAAAPRPLRKSRRLASPRKKARELAGRAVRAVDDVAGVIAGELMADRDGAAALEAVERLRVAAVELVRAKAIFIEACQKIAQLAPPDAGASPAVVALGSPDADIPVTVASEAEPVSQAYSGGADALSATVEPSTPPIVSSPVTDDDDDMLNVDESLHPDKDKSSPGTEDEDDMFDVDGRMNQSHIPLSASPTIVRRRSRLRRRYVA